jgi:hypothetical protein
MKSYLSKEEAEGILKKGKDWTGKHPNVIFAADGEGFGKDVMMVSFYKDYPSYSDFMRSLALEWSEIASEFGSFPVSVGSGFEIKPFDLKYLADDL